MENIDFVMIWVDGSDLAWQKEKSKYQVNKSRNIDDGEERYRDWGILRYWFRAVEKYAPWVHRVYFVTCGQIPEWLNLESQKLKFVKHSDYMPKEYLPTFSSHPIELNLHRIEGLSEQFVYFNDDMFLTRPVSPGDFFIDGIPVHPALLHAILPMAGGNNEIMSHIYVNMITSINRNFNARQSIKENKNKWYNLNACGFKNLIMNLFNAQHRDFVGFANEHLPVPILKSTMEDVWAKEGELLHETSCRKFRSSQDVSQYLFRYWDLANGNFVPVRADRLGKRYMLQLDSSDICAKIRNQNHKMICLNDMSDGCTYEQFEVVKNQLINAFETILPDISCFER